jgi:hypothetical protein
MVVIVTFCFVCGCYNDFSIFIDETVKKPNYYVSPSFSHTSGYCINETYSLPQMTTVISLLHTILDKTIF